LSITNKDNSIINASELINRINITNSTGSVLLSKIYGEDCLDNNIQLYGAFLTAVQLFVKDLSSNKSCASTQNHTLEEIRLQCCSFYIRHRDNFTITCLMPRSSLLLQEKNNKILNLLLDQIMSNYLMFINFSSEFHQNPELLKEYSDDFSSSIDSFFQETLSPHLGPIDVTNNNDFQLYNIEDTVT